MTPPNQPLPASPAAVRVPPLDQASQLLHLWGELAQRAASAAAHGMPEELSLLRSQHQVEEALNERFPDCPTLLDELIIWESSLMHQARATAPENCLICHRARLELPLELPLPARRGGTS